MTLALRPIGLREANTFVAAHHRHHPRARGCKFAVGATMGGVLVGVAIVGRPVSRHLDDGLTAEVTRLCTTGERNACSLLYAACWRACRAVGYTRLITYTLATEPGASLKAAGWVRTGETRAEGWGRPSRARVDKHPTEVKFRWEVRR